jgi:hypothetical protein
VAGARDLFNLQNSETGCTVHPTFYTIDTNDAVAILEVDHSPPSNAKIKNEWSYTSTPPTYLPGVDRDKFTFTVL